MNILIIGATGLLGQSLFHGMQGTNNKIYGTIRNKNLKKFFPLNMQDNLIEIGNVLSMTELDSLLNTININLVINCISVSSINTQSREVINAIFAEFPHKLGELCKRNNIRLIQISSDGVFSGKKGNYSEIDTPDPVDLYGHAKLKGELSGNGQVTLRTSMIGHDPIKRGGLLEWFLSQKTCTLYSNYIFSGIPTNELALIIRDWVVPRPNLHGLYHISGEPISKHDLLKLISEKYETKTTIIKDDSVKINRSLSSNKFLKDTGYRAPSWPTLIDNMKRGNYKHGKNDD